jgi:hypothetical protein
MITFLAGEKFYPRQMSVNKNILLSSRHNVTSDQHALTLRFPNTFETKPGDTLALQSLSLYYSWPNISDRFNNRTFGYRWVDGEYYPVTFPPGFYTGDDIQGFLEKTMEVNGHYLVNEDDEKVFYLKITQNPVYYSYTLNCDPVPDVLPDNWKNPEEIDLTGTVPQAVFDGSNFNDLLGYAKNTSYPSTSGTTEASQFNSVKTPVISPVTSVNVSCSWVSDNTFTTDTSIIGTIVPDVQYGSLIAYSPPVLLHYPIVGGRYPSITVQFFDQEMRPLEILDRNQMNVVLILHRTTPAS